MSQPPPGISALEPPNALKKFFQKSKNNACIFRQGMILYQSCRERQAFPGVAKFGIALEWGSRGLEFESRHSDQQKALKP